MSMFSILNIYMRGDIFVADSKMNAILRAIKEGFIENEKEVDTIREIDLE